MGNYDRKLFAQLLDQAKGDRSINQFAADSGVSSAHISRLLRALLDTPPEPGTIKKLAEVSHNGVTYAQMMEASGHLSGSKRTGIYSNEKSQLLMQLFDKNNTNYPSFASKRVIPLIGKNYEGSPLLTFDKWDEQIQIPSHFDADFALRVAGNTLSWVGIQEGDIALLKQTDYVTNGEIVSIAQSTPANNCFSSLYFYLKRDSRVLLRSANPEYEDIPLTPQHHIIGIVVGVIKDTIPTLSEYENLFSLKELHDKQWIEAIETAISYGITAEQVKQLIQIQANIAANIKQSKKQT